jgi:magnesium transporter
VETETKTHSVKAGLPPGTLIHIGEKRTESTLLSLIEYDETTFSEKKDATLADVVACTERPGVSWVNVIGLARTDIIAQIGDLFHLHPLTQEDIVNTTQRPKFENFDEYLFFVVKMLSIEGGEVYAEQVSIVLTRCAVISFQEQEGDVFDAIRTRIQSGKGRIRKAGADYLAYALLDAVVDGYFEVFEQIGERIEVLEEELVRDPTPSTMDTMYSLKRDLIYLRKSIWPLREVVSGLERSDSDLISEPTVIYLKDVYDHVIQVADTLETYRDMVGGMLDIYLSSVSNRMNEIMKVLTIIATIFIPLTFLAGLYGMNFGNMPELRWEYGYFTLLLVMALVAGGEVLYFRKRGWL